MPGLECLELLIPLPVVHTDVLWVQCLDLLLDLEEGKMQQQPI